MQCYLPSKCELLRVQMSQRFLVSKVKPISVLHVTAITQCNNYKIPPRNQSFVCCVDESVPTVGRADWNHLISDNHSFLKLYWKCMFYYKIHISVCTRLVLNIAVISGFTIRMNWSKNSLSLWFWGLKLDNSTSMFSSWNYWYIRIFRYWAF